MLASWFASRDYANSRSSVHEGTQCLWWGPWWHRSYARRGLLLRTPVLVIQTRESGFTAPDAASSQMRYTNGSIFPGSCRSHTPRLRRNTKFKTEWSSSGITFSICGTEIHHTTRGEYESLDSRRGWFYDWCHLQTSKEDIDKWNIDSIFGRSYWWAGNECFRARAAYWESSLFAQAGRGRNPGMGELEPRDFSKAQESERMVAPFEFSTTLEHSA